MQNILVVDHNSNVQPHIESEWRKRGFLLQLAETYEVACDLIHLAFYEYYLVTLAADHLQHKTLLAVQAVRKITNLPILVLTSTYKAEEQLKALDLGADNYLRTPGSFAEEIAVGYALIRRYQIMLGRYGDQSVLDYPCGLSIHLKQRRAEFKGQEMGLARREFDLLCRLARNANIVLDYPAIYENVWKNEYDGDSAQFQLRNSIKKLRQAFMRIDGSANFIKTEKNVGYRLSFSHVSAITG